MTGQTMSPDVSCFTSQATTNKRTISPMTFVLGICLLATYTIESALAEPLSRNLSTHRDSHRASCPKKRTVSLVDNRFTWPTWNKFFRVVTLRDYNTKVVTLGTLLLGICAGTVGVFMLLRKRSLVGDVVGHASLPGIAIAFIVMETIRPNSGRSLPGLLSGALATGIIGVLCTMAIHRYTRLKDDAAMAIVLSVFFGLGITLFTIVQKLPTGGQAGLRDFIYGNAASIGKTDVQLIAIATAIVLAICCSLFKEFSLLCFDEDYAATQGWPVLRLDLMLMGVVVAVSVIGLQSVGLLLIVAMLIIPATSARFWTDRLGRMTLISATLGGLTAFVGIMVSALFPRLAAGAVIVLVGSVFFLISMTLGIRHGVIRRVLIHHRLRRRVGRHDLLRTFYECLEPLPKDSDAPITSQSTQQSVEFGRLLTMRSWTTDRLERLLKSAVKDGLMRRDSVKYRLTETGNSEAQRVVRNHRLWEIFLITYADIAPSHVDRDADRIEHVLEPELLNELEELLIQRFPELKILPSPHPL